MTIRMVGDLIDFLLIMAFVLAAFISMLYVWVCASEPYLTEELTEGKTGVERFFLTIYKVLDIQLATGDPMLHELLESGDRHEGSMRYFLFFLGVSFYVVVALLLLSI